jgi:hypothetical protein
MRTRGPLSCALTLESELVVRITAITEIHQASEIRSVVRGRRVMI